MLTYSGSQGISDLQEVRCGGMDWIELAQDRDRWRALLTSGVPKNFFRGGSTNSVEDRGQRERGSGGVAPQSGVLEAAVIWYKKFHFI